MMTIIIRIFGWWIDRSDEVCSSCTFCGVLHLCISEHVAVQLGLETLEQREVVTASGHKQTCPYVGPVQITFQNRNCYVGAIILGDEVLLGAVPMEDMDLVISPAKQTVEVNPNSPNIPMSMAK